jgi:hypothetical protein
LQATGWELVNLQAGVDCRLAAGLHLGPFLALTAAEYSSKMATGSSPESFDGALALHGWLVIGVRGALDIGWRASAGE